MWLVMMDDKWEQETRYNLQICVPFKTDCGCLSTREDLLNKYDENGVEKRQWT